MVGGRWEDSRLVSSFGNKGPFAKPLRDYECSMLQETIPKRIIATEAGQTNWRYFSRTPTYAGARTTDILARTRRTKERAFFSCFAPLAIIAWGLSHVVKNPNFGLPYFGFDCVCERKCPMVAWFPDVIIMSWALVALQRWARRISSSVWRIPSAPKTTPTNQGCQPLMRSVFNQRCMFLEYSQQPRPISPMSSD